jgi:hypothetical protein
MHQECKTYSVRYGIRADLAYILIRYGVSELQHSRTVGHNEPSTTQDQRLHVQLRSS